MKPRLYRFGGLWNCKGQGQHGSGLTPHMAYNAWKMFVQLGSR